MRLPWRKPPEPEPDPAGEPPVEPLMRSPIGDFYSPMYDTREIPQIRDRLWPDRPRPTLGIEWREEEQLALCDEVFARQESQDFPEESSDPVEFFVKNGQYPPLDAWVLEGVMRHFEPSRMVEVGCGYSTLISSRVNREHLGSALKLTCIDPYPKPFLSNEAMTFESIRAEKVEDAPLELFEQLGENDILFIDTSHTVKTGGDVTWLFHEVLPRLRPGVLVHIHDIFLPHEYPEPWVMEGWGWNEMYLVRSFLLYNSAFEIVWGASFMLTHHRERVVAAFPDMNRNPKMGGASLWIRRKA